MIELTDAAIIGTGTRRVCFSHPGDPSRCIKIPKGSRNGVKQQKREVSYYRQLDKRGVSTMRITRYHGSVETSRGTGYVYDLIRDEDGSYSRQLGDYLRKPGNRSQQYIYILQTLEQYFFDNRVLFYDLNPWNILCRAGSDGSLEPFVIDGVGDVVAFPVLNYFDRLLLGKIARRWRRFTDKLDRRHEWMQNYQIGDYRSKIHPT